MSQVPRPRSAREALSQYSSFDDPEVDRPLEDDSGYRALSARFGSNKGEVVEARAVIEPRGAFATVGGVTASVAAEASSRASADNALATDITTVEVAINNGGNLLPYPSFEDGSGSTATGWIEYNNTPGTEPSTSSRVAGRLGGVALRITWTGTNTSTKGFHTSPSTADYGVKGGWVAGATYVISWWARADSTKGAGMNAYWNTAPTQTTISCPNLSTSWQRYAYRLVWGGTTESNGRCFISYISAAAATGWIEMDDVQVEAGDTLTTYSSQPQLIEASVVTEASARASADGSIHAKWGVALDVNNRIKGRINLDGTNESSTFVVAVDKFVIENATATITAFEIVTGGKIVMGADVQSNNYSAGSAGWRIERTGNAEFNNVTVRGSIYSTAGTIGGFTLASSTLSAGSSGTLVRLSANEYTGLHIGGVAMYSTATSAPSSGGYFLEMPNAILYCPYNYTIGYLELQSSGVTQLKLLGSGSIQIAGTQVLGSQQAAIADLSLAGVTYATESASIDGKINDILAALRSHGLIAT